MGEKTFIELLVECEEGKTPILINGNNKAGRVLAVYKDYISFQSIWEEEKTKGKEKEKVLKKEIIHIPIKDISSVSEGEKEIPKTEKETAIDSSLEGL